MHKFEPTRVEKTKKKTSHVQIFFCFFLCKWRELVKETFYVKKNRGHQASMRVKSSRSYRNGYSPYMWLESFLSARARCMTWRNVATGITCAVNFDFSLVLLGEFSVFFKVCCLPRVLAFTDVNPQIKKTLIEANSFIQGK